MSVCLSLGSDSSESIKAIITKLATVTASDMGLHHGLNMLTLTFVQCHIDLNRKNNKCSIISKTVQTMLIKFTVKIA